MRYGRKKLQNLTIVEQILVVWSDFTLKARKPEEKYNSLINNLDILGPHLFLRSHIFVGQLFMGSEIVQKKTAPKQWQAPLSRCSIYEQGDSFIASLVGWHKGTFTWEKEQKHLMMNSLSETWCMKGVLVNLICRAFTLGSCKRKGELWKCLRWYELRPAWYKAAEILWVVSLQDLCLDNVVYIHDEFLVQESLKLPWTWNEHSFRVLYVTFENNFI